MPPIVMALYLLTICRSRTRIFSEEALMACKTTGCQPDARKDTRGDRSRHLLHVLHALLAQLALARVQQLQRKRSTWEG